ncbi:hypothetical protein [Yoonia sp. SS1-5]|uniref:Uncharacterized protein n=1 Tax=Yoonia rhodophyticola TaxID=3137370 RepID=A0AAN0NL71_9RHOB
MIKTAIALLLATTMPAWAHHSAPEAHMPTAAPALAIVVLVAMVCAAFYQRHKAR